MVAFSDLKVGDIVHVRQRVLYIDERCLQFCAVSGRDIKPEDILKVESRPVTVGDIVTWGVGQIRGLVVDIHNAKAGIRLDYGNGDVTYYSHEIEGLRHAS